jgi:hypothetical protein
LSVAQVQESIRSAVILQAGVYDPLDDNHDRSLENDTTSPKPFEISLWALDAGICSVLKFPIPGLAASSSRSLDSIMQQITDKHERGLLANVISPNEIGVTYDMIGGLDDVKESMRQCITYPLKYPRLYQVC